MGNESAKGLATQLRRALEGYGFTLKHGQALDVVAKLTGAADWNVLSAQLNRASVTEEAVSGCHKCGSALLNGYCTDETCLYSDWPQAVAIALVVEQPPEEIERRTGVQPRIRVPAEIHSDDWAREVEFDCDAWFAQASDTELLALAEREFGGDVEADAVALFFEATLPELAEVFAYARQTQRRRDPVGFEVHVDEAYAMRWLKAHRPGVWAVLRCREADIRLVEAEEPEIKGRWDWIGPRDTVSDASFESEQAAALDALQRLQLL